MSISFCLFFSFFLFAHKSNLVPTTKENLKNKHFLMQKDVSVEANMLIISFRFSKTIQFGERILQTPLIEIEDSILCPYKHFLTCVNQFKLMGRILYFHYPTRNVFGIVNIKQN